MGVGTLFDQRPTTIDQRFPLSHPATSRTAWRRLRTTGHRQRSAVRTRLGWRTHLAFDAPTLAFWAFDFFVSVRNERLEFVVAAATGIIVERHRSCSSIKSISDEAEYAGRSRAPALVD